MTISSLNSDICPLIRISFVGVCNTILLEFCPGLEPQLFGVCNTPLLEFVPDWNFSQLAFVTPSSNLFRIGTQLVGVFSAQINFVPDWNLS